MILSIYRAIIALLTFIFVGVLLQAIYIGDVDNYWRLIAQDPLVRVTGLDVYLSIAMGCVMASILERRWWVGLVLFVLAIPIGGPLLGIYLLWRLPTFLENMGISGDSKASPKDGIGMDNDDGDQI